MLARTLYNPVSKCVMQRWSYPCSIPRRNLNLQSTVESIAKTQTGIFKAISESTPVEYLQNFLITVHDTTGLPWWATIVCSTMMLRASVTAPLAIYQHYIMAKIENLQMEMPEIVKDLKRETAIAVKLFNWDERTARIQYNKSLRKQWNNLIVRDNCHPFKATFLVLVQIPMWVSFSVSLRNLVYMLPQQDINAQLRFAEFTVGGFGWIPNLTVPDSSLILPVAMGLINLTIIEMQLLSKVTIPTKFQKFVTNLFRGFSIFMVPVAASVPSCLALYWTTSCAFGLCQNLIIISPKVRRLFRIPQTATELNTPYQHLLKGFKYKYNFFNKSKVT